MKKLRLKFGKIFGDYFFLLLLLLGIGANYYFEMKVNRSIKRFTADHEAILSYKEMQDKLREMDDLLDDHEQSVRAMMAMSDTAALAAIHDKEAVINRKAIVITQKVQNISPVDHLVGFRESIQSKFEFEQQLIDAWLNNRDAAREMASSGQLISLQKLYKARAGLLLSDIDNVVEAKKQQVKKDRVDLISLDYAIPHLTTFIFLVIAAFTIFKIFQVSRLNKDLNEAITKEQKAQDVKDQFMDTMTHELRSPLNSVLGYTNLLLKTKLDGDQHKYVKSIKTSGELLLGVINEVLDYSKIRSGYIRIASSPFRFRDQMSALTDIVRDKVSEKGLEFRCEIADEIPDDLRGDSVKLLQVLLNLTYNAIKFTNEGSITVKASCKERRDDQVVLQIRVEDTGIGMPADKLPRIFERFYQVEGVSSRAAVGTGLGLSITREILTMQGGSITVESEVNKGSVFHVTIPYEVVADHVGDAELQMQQLQKKLPSSMRVLAVDDNSLNREMMAALLKMYGVQYEMAQTGMEAVRILGEKQFDVVLMDLQMPGMDGKEATRRIREELSSDVPIVALSAYAEVAEKQNCLACGMDAYLTKPLKEEELYETLEFYTPQHEIRARLDLDYLRKMSNGNMEFIESVVLRVADSLPREISDLKQALINNDQQKVNTMSHDMKTTFAVLGIYDSVEEALTYLESWRSSHKTMSVAGHMVHMLEDVAREISIQLEEFSAGRSQ